MTVKKIFCTPKGTRCQLLASILKEDKGTGITTTMQASQTIVKGKKTMSLRLLVGYRAKKRDPILLFNVCPYCEGRLLDANA